ncbi:MAG: peptide ABC transporter substrate-binding protein, partial [Chloroflexota bacterium]
MGRYIRWQAIITVTGIAMTLAFLGFLSFSRSSVTIVEENGTYTEGVAGLPQFINPLLAQYNPVDADLTALIFNGLTQTDGQGGLLPDLAEDWSISDDGLVYLFKLREDVQWQDGEPFTADDVLFTLTLIQSPDFPGVPQLHQLWRTITIEKLDNHRIQFILPEALPTFTDFTTVGVLPEHLLSDVPADSLLRHPFNLAPVGTGPFRLEEVNSEIAQLTPNPLYFGDEPRLPELTLRFYETYQAVAAAYQRGEVQGISFIPPQDLETVREFEGLTIHTARQSGYQIIYLNLQEPDQLPFFQEAGIRQALLYGLNRQEIIAQTLSGQGLVAAGPIYPWSWAYNSKQPQITFDLEKANQLLDDAGWLDTDDDGIRDREGQAFT